MFASDWVGADAVKAIDEARGQGRCRAARKPAVLRAKRERRGLASSRGTAEGRSIRFGKPIVRPRLSRGMVKHADKAAVGAS